MKTILYTIFAVILFASCGKKEYCYQCQHFEPIAETWTYESENHCGWTNEDKVSYEKSHDAYFTIGGKRYHSFVSCAIVH